MQHHTAPHDTAEQRKETGQNRSLFKAGTPWIEQALERLREYVGLRANEGEVCFTFEQFRIYAKEVGMADPDSNNAWGALTKSAVAAKLCVGTERFIKAKRPESHARMIRVWRAL